MSFCRTIFDEIVAEKAQRDEKAKIISKIPDSFFSLTQEQEAAMIQSTQIYWDTFLGKVKQSIGQVLLATIIGSRRYGVSTPESDLDLFVVAVTPLNRFLQYPPFEQTFKNPESTLKRNFSNPPTSLFFPPFDDLTFARRCSS